ncbi:MAG: hypothetical protein QW292_07150 [Candidatus Parvarchaeota archaeon]
MLKDRRITIVLDEGLVEFFNQHPELNVSKFTRIALSEKIGRLGNGKETGKEGEEGREGEKG